MSETPVHLGAERQLFIDDALIHARQGLTRRWHQPTKHAANPVLSTAPADAPGWEAGMPICFGSVLHDAETGMYRMWYGLHEGGHAADAASVLAYATSRDGLVWDRPSLGLLEYRATRSNNLVRTRDGLACSVMRDDGETDPRRRYKMLYCDASLQVSAAHSPDGLGWTEYAEHNPVISYPPGHDSQNVLYWDEQLGKYVAIVRERRGRIAAVRPQVLADEDSRQAYRRLWQQWPDEKSLRRIGQSESDDLIHWSPLRLVLAADERDPVLGGELYNMQVMVYEGVRVGLVTVFSADAEYCRGPVQLASSRDGLNWHRPDDRHTFLALSDESGDFDWGAIYPYQSPLVVGDEIRIYYNGVGLDHNHEPLPGVAGFPNGVGLATLRLDGFASMAAAGAGELTTRLLTFAGSALRVNADADGASLRVEVLDERAQPIRGFGREDCNPLERDEIRHTVTWRGHSDLTGLAGRAVQLRFHVEDANLFSFQVG